MDKKIQAIVTMPPYAQHMGLVLKHDIVAGIRLNTVMPIKGSLENVLERMNKLAEENGKEFWVDLKCRQLRVKSFGVPPFTEIELTHEIEVDTPTRAYFSDRQEYADVLEVNKNKLIMKQGPKRVVGPGESVTIPNPTLKINNYFTERDKEYIEACNNLEIKNYMLSFAESEKDIKELLKYSPDANIVAKIESQKGIDFVRESYKNKNARLMAARGDLFLELEWPHKVIDALELVLEKDSEAIVASRMFGSLIERPEPVCEEIGDVDNLLRMGYRTFMFGDDICQEERPIIAALNLFSVMAEKYR